MASPFDDEGEHFLVLVNDENQHSLWPASIPVPGGWINVHGPANREASLQFVEAAWTDLRPLSLIQVMGESGAARKPQYVRTDQESPGVD